MISGILPDDRDLEEKKKDYKTEEVLTAQPLVWTSWEEWKEKKENKKMLEEVEVNYQDGVGSCAAQAGSLVSALHNYTEDGKFIKYSAKPIYARRLNRPGRGMWMSDLGNICVKNGTVPEVLYPSPNDTEENMSNLDGYISAFEAFGKILKAKNYFWLSGNDINLFAQVLALNKPIVLAVKFGRNEWGSAIAPQIKDATTEYGHAIAGLLKGFVTYQTKRAIVIQDSHGDKIGYGGRRILTEDWFVKGRVLPSIWFEDLNNLAIFNQQGTTEKPKYVFKRELDVGMIGYDVAMLQRCLGYLKDDGGWLFPLATPPTGNYYGVTRNAVQRFQKMYGIEQVGRVGPQTLAKLNEIFK